MTSPVEQLVLIEAPRRPSRAIAGGVERLPAWRGRDMDAHPWPVTLELSVCRWCEREVPACCIVDDIVSGICGLCFAPVLDKREADAIAAAIEAARRAGPPHPRRDKCKWMPQRARVIRRAQELADEQRQARKLKNAAKAIARQQDRDGLFADVTDYQSPEERDTMFAERSAEMDQGFRDTEAKGWREARATLRSLTIERRTELVYRWNAKRSPATAAFFLTYLRTALRDDDRRDTAA